MVYWSDFVTSPPGFYGKDIAIDVLSGVVVLLIALFSMRNYFLNKDNKKHMFFSLAFFLLAASFIVKVLTNFLLHNQVSLSRHISVSVLGVEVVRNYSDIMAIGFLVYATFTLFGFYLAYGLTSLQKKFSMDYVIIAYFILISTYFTRFSYFLTYVSAFIFLFALSRRYFIAHRKTRLKNTFLLGISFSIITLSQAVFIFTSANHTMYILAETIQLLGYLLLLYTFIMVLKNAGKKN